MSQSLVKLYRPLCLNIIITPLQGLFCQVMMPTPLTKKKHTNLLLSGETGTIGEEGEAPSW